MIYQILKYDIMLNSKLNEKIFQEKIMPTNVCFRVEKHSIREFFLFYTLKKVNDTFYDK